MTFRVANPLIRATLQAMLDGTSYNPFLEAMNEIDTHHGGMLFEVTGAVELLDDLLANEPRAVPGELRTVLPNDADWLNATRDRD
jgi:hypothetical protein